MLKRNAPTKVDSTFCVTPSCISSRVARGLVLLVASPSALVSVVSEKVVTASIDEARIVRMLSTASAPIS